MKKEYIYIHEEPNVNLLNVQIHTEAMVEPRLKKFGGANVSSIWYAVENHRFTWGPHGKDWEEAGKTYFAKMTVDPDFTLAAERYVREAGDAMQAAAFPLLENQRHETLGDTERIELIKKFFDWNRDMCTYGFIGPVMEMPHEFVTRGLGELVDRHAAQFKRSREEYIVTLSTPTQELPTAAAHRELKEIALSGSRDASAIQKHLEKYPWIIYSYRGPVWDMQKVTEELDHLAALPDLPERLRTEQETVEHTATLQKEYTHELGLTRDEEAFLAGVRSIAYTKILRKDMLSLGNYMTHLLGRPLWERHGLTLEDIDVYRIEEFLHMLQTGEKLSENETEERKKFLLYLQYANGSEVITGEKARSWIKDNVDFGDHTAEVNELKGTVASLGQGGVSVQGVIKRVEVSEDMKNFNQGDILLSSGTTPDLLPAMRRAGAIVTDTGGLTSHAAIVSRELKIACVIGTKIATKVFKDGDRVEVDIKKGIVRKI